MLRGFFTAVQNVIRDILGEGDQNKREEATTDDTGYVTTPETAPSSVFQKPEIYHALLLYHEEDESRAQELKSALNKLTLRNGKRVRVASEDDISPSGAIETNAFNSYFQKNILFLLFITEAFIKDDLQKWKSSIGLTVSLTYGSDLDGKRFVIPVFTEKKETAPYLKCDHVIQSVAGIKYHDFNWTDRVREAFLRNFEDAEKRIALMFQGTSVD